jgi:hypothetical protein
VNTDSGNLPPDQLGQLTWAQRPTRIQEAARVDTQWDC